MSKTIEYKIMVDGKLSDGWEYTEDLSLPEEVAFDNPTNIHAYVKEIYDSFNSGEDEENQRKFVAIRLRKIITEETDIY